MSTGEPATAGTSKDRRWAFILGVYVAVCLLTFDQIDEDAFIYFRVAANIGDGFGYVYNRRGEHIEVGSSVIWQYLLALVHFLSLDVVFFAKLLGVLAGGGALYFVWRLSLEVISDRTLVVFPALLLSVTYPFYCGADRGLETAPYALAVVTLAYFLVEERLRRHWYAPAIALVLMRPEGFIGLLGLPAFLYYERRHLRHHLLCLAAVLGVMAAATVWRFFYFHDLVPHAYYLKIQGDDVVGRLAASLFVEKTALWIPFIPAAIGLLHRRAWDRTTITLAIYGAPFLWWGIGFQAGLAQYNRHLVAPLCIGYVLAGRGLDVLASRWRVLAAPLAWGLSAFTAWLALGAHAVRGGFSVVDNPVRLGIDDLVSEPGWVVRNFGAMVANRRRPRLTMADVESQRLTSTWMYLLGDFIDRTYPHGITVVFDQAGQTAWYGGLDRTFIDPIGLASRAAGFSTFNHRLAKIPDPHLEAYRRASLRILSPWHEEARTWDFQQAADYIFSLRPHLIVLGVFSMPKQLPNGQLVADDSTLSGILAVDPRLKTDYVDRSKWWMHLYERKDMASSIHWAEGEDYIPGKADMAPERHH